MEQTITGFQVPVDIAVGVQVAQSRRNVFEKGNNLFKVHATRTMHILWILQLTLGPPPQSLLHLLLCDGSFGRVEDIAMEIAAVAVLLQYESARHARSEAGYLEVF
jgi:hypothetical protein